jgi:hypothetical protein
MPDVALGAKMLKFTAPVESEVEGIEFKTFTMERDSELAIAHLQEGHDHPCLGVVRLRVAVERSVTELDEPLPSWPWPPRRLSRRAITEDGPVTEKIAFAT